MSKIKDILTKGRHLTIYLEKVLFLLGIYNIGVVSVSLHNFAETTRIFTDTWDSRNLISKWPLVTRTVTWGLLTDFRTLFHNNPADFAIRLIVFTLSDLFVILFTSEATALRFLGFTLISSNTILSSSFVKIFVSVANQLF